MKNQFIPLCLMMFSLLYASDEDRSSRENSESAKDAHENGEGRAVDCGCCDWQSRDRDNNLPDNESNYNEGLHTPSWDRKD